MFETSSATRAGAKAIERLRHLPGEHSAVVGLSGGVDSSLTAALFVEAGWEINGLTLWLLSGKGSCCSDGLVDAAGICSQLSIPHHVVDSRETFEKEIINTLINGYQEGITPLPCSQCNRSVKFGPMINWAKENLNINTIATGHYARVRMKDEQLITKNIPGGSQGRNQLLRGCDRNKDQSYFLYDLSQDILEKVIFPLGELTKEETREEAARYNLRTAQKPESQDLCLIDLHGSMKGFLNSYIESKQGEILLSDGKLIGHHDGIHNFTIGQRKGLGISWKEPLHVIKIDASKNQIIVAPRSQSGRLTCEVGAINWVSIQPPQKPIIVEAQLRYRSKPVQAKLIPVEANQEDAKRSRPYRCRLEFTEDQFSITPGQAAVFYSGEVLLGGGIIDKYRNSND